MVQRVISESSSLDPLLLLPVPEKLPPSPYNSLDPLLAEINAILKDPPALSITLLTSQMRMLSRHAQVLLNAARVGAAEARSQLDTVDVTLKGVEYERERVKDEIAKCLNYTPRYTDMDMPSSIEFLQTSTVDLPDETDESYEYALTIARLEQELEEIQSREKRLEALSKEQEGLIKSKKEIKHKFDAVDTYLSDFAKTTSAVTRKIKDVV